MRKYWTFLINIAAPSLCVCWIGYLGYQAVAGVAGFGALADLRAEEARKLQEVAMLRERRMALELRANQLNPKALDPDMIDERVRAVLGYAGENDLVIPRDELDRLIKKASRAGG